jgi:hypothetical protein
VKAQEKNVINNVSFVKMKSKEQLAKEYINHLYGDVKKEDLPMYELDVHQSFLDFKSGFKVAEGLFKPKWLSVEEYLPKNVTPVLVKGKCCDICEPKVIAEIEDGEWFLSGHGENLTFKPTHWIQIPQ